MAVMNLKKLQLTGLKSDIDRLLSEMIKGSNIELIDTRCIYKDIRPFKQHNPYQELLNNINNIIETLDLSTSAEGIKPDIDEQLSICEVKEKIKPVQKRIKRMRRLQNRLNKEEERLNNLEKHVWLMRNMDIDLEELKNLSYISLIFGSMNKDNYKVLIENITDLPILVLEVNQEEDTVWFFTMTKKVHEEKAMKILESAYFERIELPPRATGQPREILDRVEYRRERMEIIREQIKLEFKKLAHRYGEQLIRCYNQVKLLNKICETKNNYCGQTEHVLMVKGWIPVPAEEEFKENVEEMFPKVIYDSQKVEKKEETPPTVLSNPAWVKPFESLVKLYGVPGYGELDPSMFLAITYVAIFGMMFGDVGQGAIFAGIGWLIKRRTIKIMKTENGYFLLALGFSSMVFGLGYGSIFSLEILPALMMRPLENIMFLLGMAVVLGIILIIISIGFNLINSYRQKDLGKGVFSRYGVSGLFFYLFTLGSIVSWLLRGELLLSPLLTVVLAVVPLVLIFLQEPLTHLVKGEGRVIPDKPGEYLLESLFELFDVVLGYMSNTISFVRIGAFTLNHVGLSMTFLILARMMGSGLGSFLILVIGNIVIMGLEGLVVGIQVLRLEFYEIFGKFYNGNGRKFKPLNINNLKGRL